jgi:hypothetical protein
LVPARSLLHGQEHRRSPKAHAVPQGPLAAPPSRSA